MADEDLGKLLFETFDSELETSYHGKFQSGKIFRVDGSSGMVKSEGGSVMNSESCESLRGRHMIA